MIEPGVVERRVSLHSVVPNKSILEGRGESVSGVQTSSDVGRRDRDNKGALVSVFAGVVDASSILDELFGALLETRLEETLGFPPIIPGSFYSERVVCCLRQITRDV